MSKTKAPSKVKIHVTLVPETWIIAPLMNEDQIRRWISKGWMNEDAKHLDRAFMRNADGKPVIPKLWLKACMRRAGDKMGIPREKYLDFTIVDRGGFPVEYVVIPDKPLVYRRAVLGKKRTTETFEYIDSTYTIEFDVITEHPTEFMEVLAAAGKVGLGPRTKWGYGKFRVSFRTEYVK